MGSFKVHRKGRKELGLKNCIALEPYTSWVRKRALDYRMPYDYPRPTPMVMVGPSTLPNQGVEELRDEDRSCAWVREREELLQQLRDKDAMIEFLEHQVIDEPDDVVTSLIPQSSKFWKRKYDRLAKEKADMEAAYEREVKRLRATYLPWSNSLLFIYFEDKLTHRYNTRANLQRIMEHLEQENRELKDEVARLTAMMESVLAAQSQSSPTLATPP
ncbi:hypothetical protein KIW84_057910 [Lathyrus oleraceus]|uniref:Uncharacterized protein n=1 Tax=Pisum sativum TaxID=3888 RepID=A0A9D4X791_PEA|nr:hypothetical protein KIW84_057910 [Pisum sativum]